MLEYEVIASGSKGNAVAIENVMVDCGISYKKIKPHLYDIDYLLITHRHGDHISKTTYEHIRKDFPNITVITSDEVAAWVNDDVDYIIECSDPLEIGEYTFEAFKCIHDVKTYGYCWSWHDPDTDKDVDIIYATDTKNFQYAPTRKYDYLFLESNHDEHKLNAIRKTGYKKYGYDAYGNGLRHASTQICKGFYYLRRKSEDSVLIELHRSERFY